MEVSSRAIIYFSIFQALMDIQVAANTRVREPGTPRNFV